MSNHVTPAISETTPKNSTSDMLEYIIAHYKRRYRIDESLQKVVLYELVAKALSRESKIRTWQWRYIQSVRNHTLNPGRYIRVATANHYKRLKNPPKVKVYSYKHIKIRKDDATSAAATIRNSGATVEYRRELSELLR